MLFRSVFVTEPLLKKAKPASTSEGEEDPWYHIHHDGNHLLKDCCQVNGLAVHAQRQGGGAAQAPATAADSPGTTLETAPRVAKVVTAGGGDGEDVGQTTRSSSATGMLRLPRVAATGNSKKSMVSSGASTGEPPCLPQTALARDSSGS